jgi:hypothetical protein
MFGTTIGVLDNKSKHIDAHMYTDGCMTKPVRIAERLKAV